MKASLLFAMALALLLCWSPPIQAQPDFMRFDSTATLMGHVCHVLNLSVDGELMESEYFYEENGYVRFAAFQNPGGPIVILGDNYYIMKQVPQIGDTWLAWVGIACNAEVESSEMMTVPAGTFPAFEVGYSEVGGEHVSTIYWANSVGGVVRDYGGYHGELTDYSLVSGSGCFPLAVGNWWTYEWTTGVKTEPQSSPSSFFLLQAYPNPFNPTATLSYELQAASLVNLSVYDVSGRLVAELVNGWREAGANQVTFDGSGLRSGVYVYWLQAGEFGATGKLVLMK